MLAADEIVTQLERKGGGRELTPSVATACAHTTLGNHPVAMFGCELSWSAAGLGIYAKAGVPSFNCPNTTADFANPWSFAIVAGQVGDLHAGARYLSTLATRRSSGDTPT